MPNQSASSESALVRALGVRAMAANTVNNVIGAGIFGLPAAVAAVLGQSAVVAYAVCAAAVGLVALCFAEAGSRVSVSGGPYAYVEAAFGPFPGFLVGVLFWLGSQAVASAAVAALLAASVAQLVPALGGGVARAAFLVLLYGGLAAINIRGVRSGARLVEATTLAKLAPLLILVVAGLWAASPAHLAWGGMPSAANVGRASLLLVFAFTGTEGALTPGGEVRDPARTIPRAILTAMAFIVALYVGVQLAAQGVLGADLARGSATPLADAAGRLFGHTGFVLMLAAAAVSTFGYLSGDMLGSPRLLFAFGRDGFLPPRLARVHPRFRTPAVAIAVHAAVCCGLALTGTFRTLALLSVVAILLIYLACCAGVLAMRRRGVRLERAPFRTPGGPLVPVLGCGVVLWLLASATRGEFLAVGAMLVAASVLYAARTWRRTGRAAAQAEGAGAIVSPLDAVVPAPAVVLPPDPR